MPTTRTKRGRFDHLAPRSNNPDRTDRNPPVVGQGGASPVSGAPAIAASWATALAKVGVTLSDAPIRRS